ERTLKVKTGPKSLPAEIRIAAHGSATAFSPLKAGDAEIGMASRPIGPQELQGLGQLSDPGFEHVVALAGVAIIVHPGNPGRELNRKQVADVFSGALNNWSALGGRQAPIVVYARDDKSGTYDSFKAMVLDGNHLTLTPSAKRFESSSDLSEKVAQDPNGIGFI